MKSLSSLWFILMVATVSAEVTITGTDFMTGSGAVDASRFLAAFLEDQDKKIITEKDPFSLGFSVISRWTPALLLVRDTDNRGLPLLGPTAGGQIHGSLMAYRAAVSYRFSPYIGVYLAADYFVASHIDNFFRLFDPWYTSNDVLSFFGFLFTGGLYGPLTGGRATGFAAMAGQFLPGIELKYPGWVELQLGGILKFRDPIDEDGRFISTYTVEKSSWTGVIGKQLGDYLDKSHIPQGVGGFEASELYFKLKLLGVDSQTLFTPAGGLKALTAGPDFLGMALKSGVPSPWKELAALFRPFGGFLNEGYSRFNAAGGWFGLVKGDYQGSNLGLSYLTEFDFYPFHLNTLRSEVRAYGFLAGFSWKRLDLDYRLGWKLGLGGGFNTLTYELSWAWNYSGTEVGNLEILDDVVFNFLIQI